MICHDQEGNIIIRVELVRARVSATNIVPVVIDLRRLQGPSVYRNPFDLCFDTKRPYFGWLVVQNGGHSGSRYLFKEHGSVWDWELHFKTGHGKLLQRQFRVRVPCHEL